MWVTHSLLLVWKWWISGLWALGKSYLYNWDITVTLISQIFEKAIKNVEMKFIEFMFFPSVSLMSLIRGTHFSEGSCEWSTHKKQCLYTLLTEIHYSGKLIQSLIWLLKVLIVFCYAPFHFTHRGFSMSIKCVKVTAWGWGLAECWSV